jgi:UDP-N-acetylmuramoyl-tripeptide--D-alanyl-D-alanine ligase
MGAAMPVLWRAEQAAAATAARGPSGQPPAGWAATGVSIDSRTVAPGDLFVALRGPTHDAHDFVAAALAAGAAAAVVERVPPGVAADAPLLVVADTMQALEALGADARRRSRARFIAITGSVGKTGTKEAIALALGAEAPTYASAGNLNNQWGVPLSLARLPPDVTWAVFELGMNHAGEILALTRQVRPDIAVITTIEAVHLEFFDSVAGIADAKAEIFAGMPPTGVAILNRDNAWFDRLAGRARDRGLTRIVGFGRHPQAEARLIDCSLHASCSAVSASILGERLDYCLAMPGMHWALSSLAVLAAVHAAGGEVGPAAAQLARLKPLKGRGQRFTVRLGSGPFEVIDESYNASPVAVTAALGVLGRARPGAGGRRIAVLGDMLELGRDAPRLHAALAADVEANSLDLLFTAGPLMRHLHDQVPAARRGGHAADSAALAPLVAAAVRPGDIVLVKGSLGSRMAPLVEALRRLDTRGDGASGGGPH